MQIVFILITTLLALATEQGFADSELKLLAEKGDCPELKIELSPGSPTVIGLDGFELNQYGLGHDHKQCLIGIEVLNLPRGYQVGLNPMQVKGFFETKHKGFASMRLRYHFLGRSSKRQINSRWDKPSAKTIFTKTGPKEILWGACEKTKFFLGLEILSAGMGSEDFSRIHVSELSFPAIHYKRCTEAKD